jgi:hypothetical protein
MGTSRTQLGSEAGRVLILAVKEGRMIPKLFLWLFSLEEEACLVDPAARTGMCIVRMRG